MTTSTTISAPPSAPAPLPRPAMRPPPSSLAIESLARGVAIVATLADVLRAGLAPERHDLASASTLPPSVNDVLSSEVGIDVAAHETAERGTFANRLYGCMAGDAHPTAEQVPRVDTRASRDGDELKLLRELAEVTSEHFLAVHMLDFIAIERTRARAHELLQKWRGGRQA